MKDSTPLPNNKSKLMLLYEMRLWKFRMAKNETNQHFIENKFNRELMSLFYEGIAFQRHYITQKFIR